MSKKKTKAPSIKTNIHNIFQTDERREEEGAWVVVNEFQGLKIKVRRIKSDYAIKAYEKRLREEAEEGTLRDGKNEEVQTQLFYDHLAEVILCDWKNLRDDESGESIPYSAEVARELVEVKDFREFIVQAASERDTFREQADADAEGN